MRAPLPGRRDPVRRPPGLPASSPVFAEIRHCGNPQAGLRVASVFLLVTAHKAPQSRRKRDFSSRGVK
jgi:hypothetical protein